MRDFDAMSRLTKRLNGFRAIGALLLLGTAAHGESIGDLTARAKKVSDAREAIDLSRALRRAGLQGVAVAAARRGFARARGGELAELRLELARAYIEQRQAKKATRECDQLHKLSVFTEQICIAESQLLSRRGSVALPAAEQALKLVPGDYDALVAKGRALMQLSNPGDAEAAFGSAIGAAPSRPEARRFLGELLLAQGRQSDAVAAFREACRVAPDDPDALVLLAEALPTATEAKQILEHALEARPAFARAEARLGRVLAALGDLSGAEKSLDAALKIDPQQPDWLAGLGEVYLAKKEPDRAMKAALEALKIVANHGPAKLVEARALAAKGEIDLAVEAFQAAYGLARTTPDALIDATRACLQAGRLTTAKAFADRATEDFPKASLAWEMAGDVAAASKEIAFARQAYGKALSGEGAADKDGIRRKLASIK
jgi:tetratricopeptide (TPR) repeat protein